MLVTHYKYTVLYFSHLLLITHSPDFTAHYATLFLTMQM